MQIPKKIKVGTKTYAVIQVKKARTKNTLAAIDYQHGIIWMATHDMQGTKLGKEEMADTFWHELTHAVLHDMGHDLCYDEKFVTAFANRLSLAVDSAQL
jgi:hypothetical protein